MNQTNDMNKRVAEARGWRYVKRLDMSLHNQWWLEPREQWLRYTGDFLATNCQAEQPPEWSGNIHGGKLPNYTESLDAIREAVLAQDEEFQQRFSDELVNLCIRSARVHHQLSAADWCAAFLAVVEARKNAAEAVQGMRREPTPPEKEEKV